MQKKTVTSPRALGLAEAAGLIRNRSLTSTDLVRSCLERIRQREATVNAWVEVYEDQALTAARACDQAAANGGRLGPLHGIPIGVKDIIDVRDMWTRAGCAVYPARIAAADAPAVARLRAAGAIFLGKTETTAFANNDPAPTCNPWNPRHTPGGSSSGSGAAVADLMCPAALGTQTGGSVLRPAAYNGIVGLKPTCGAISTDGVIPVSWTLDHIGPHARRVEDVRILFNLMRTDVPDLFTRMPPRPETIAGSTPQAPFRLGFFRKFCEREAAPEMATHVDTICRNFEHSGAHIVSLDLTQAFAEAAVAHRIIMDTELATAHRERFGALREQYPPNIRARIEKGLGVHGHEYVGALRRRIAFQRELSAALADVDAAVLPTAPSTAPEGLASTGSPVFCVPWSLAGFPAITIPSGLDDQGLPLAVQLGAKPYDETTLLAAAAWCEGQLSFSAGPPA